MENGGSRMAEGHELAVQAEQAFCARDFGQAGKLHQQAADSFREAAALVSDDVTKGTLVTLSGIQEGRAKDALGKTGEGSLLAGPGSARARPAVRSEPIRAVLSLDQPGKLQPHDDDGRRRGVAAGMLEAWKAFTSLTEMLPVPNATELRGASAEVVQGSPPETAQVAGGVPTALTPVALEAMAQLQRLMAPASPSPESMSEQEAQMRRQFETQLLDSAATVRKLVSENQRLKQSVDEFQRVAEENDMLWCSIKEFGEAVEGQGRYVRTAANAILLDPNS
eukprot:TRINITY_DN12633_c0_g1_i9.p1 TRINITY_DN12633_c0_g1~~TRINITY_DN12633_c0_g1_i9.p1  ORF type:complete len:280 (-),score=48.73 TRINITY_DN12633_c0_g1_i9:464-1303(-)